MNTQIKNVVCGEGTVLVSAASVGDSYLGEDGQPSQINAQFLLSPFFIKHPHKPRGAVGSQFRPGERN
jgi:hypothetical protein